MFLCPGLSGQNVSRIHQPIEAFNLGVQQALQERHKEALQLFGRAIHLDPHFAQAHLASGISQLKLKQFPEAVSSFSRLLELAPQHWEQAYYFRGMAKAGSGDYHGAKADFSQAIGLNPDYLSFYQRGKANFALGQYAAALQDFEISLRMQPQFAQGVLNRGKAFYHLGQFSEALDDLNLSVIKFPHYAEPYYYRGLVYRALQNELAARENFDLALRYNPQLEIPEPTLQKQPDLRTPEAAPPVEEEVGGAAESLHQIPLPGEETIRKGPIRELESGLYDHHFAPAPSMQGYGVQVASYTGTEYLTQLISSYQQRYQHPVFIHVQKEEERKLYKIIIGAMGQRPQAEALRNNLRSTDFPDCFVVTF